MATATTPLKQPAHCLTLAMIGGAVLGVITHWNSFAPEDILKPFVALFTISWFP